MSEEIVSFRPSGQHAWTSRANCARPGAPDMFPHDADLRAQDAARVTCLGCPVRVECLTEAFERGEQHGVWGGLNTDERNSLRRRVMRAANHDNHRRVTRAELEATAARVAEAQTAAVIETAVSLVKGMAA